MFSYQLENTAGQVPNASGVDALIVEHGVVRSMLLFMAGVNGGIGDRLMAKLYKTGEKCVLKGNYKWVEYVDLPKHSPRPTSDELEIPLSVGETFPPVKSSNRGCFRELK